VKRSACFLICAMCLVGGASANDIRISFGQPEFVPPVDDFIPEAHWGEYAPPGAYTLGIWAEIQMDFSGSEPAMDCWDQISVNIVSSPAVVTVSDLTMDNFNHRLGSGSPRYRWDPSSDFGTGGHFCLTAFGAFGLGGLYPSEFGAGDGLTDRWSYTIGTPGEAEGRYRYWLGNVTLSSAEPARVWLDMGFAGIHRVGGSSADHVYFGETEELWWFEPPPFGGFLPDFTFTPEPGSALLMAVAGWLLRRR
jgi:hypothetical protein